MWLVWLGVSARGRTGGPAPERLAEAGRAATVVPAMRFVTTAPVIGPHDSIVVISHTGETAYALAARALAFEHSIDTITITRTHRPYAYDLCDAYNSRNGRHPTDDYAWFVDGTGAPRFGLTPAAEQRMRDKGLADAASPIAPSRARARPSDQPEYA